MKQRVLVVDDEPELVRALILRLTANGFTCESAVNGQDALARIEKKHPDLVVADLIMPEMDGYELCRRLQSNRATKAIPILVLTAVPERSLEDRLQVLGPIRVIRKPFDSQRLIATIQEMLSITPSGGTGHG